MKRSPEDHYTIAERHVDQAHKALDVTVDSGQTLIVRADAARELISHAQLADLHRKMAETGLAFVHYVYVDPDAELVERDTTPEVDR